MALKPAWVSNGLVLAFVASALPGCDPLSQLNREWEALKIVITGGRSPLAKTSVPAEPTSRPESARRAKANAELLREMLVVVHDREPTDRAEFGNLVDTLNQGASLEGMYNGFTHSGNYRRLEVAASPAAPATLKAFSEELALLEAELPEPTPLSVDSAKPLAQADMASFAYAQTAEARPEAEQAEPKAERLSPEGYAGLFARASVFTLKRVLGDEALKVVNAKKDSPEKLIAWYSKWALHMAERNIDFGIPLRGIKDESFHARWATSATEDQLKWEVLNRLHRVLNETNRQKP